MSKAELLNIHISQMFNEKVETKCDDNTGYAICLKCCNVVFEPKSELTPKFQGSVVCVKCQDVTLGMRKTLSPKLMFENQSDEGKILKLGEPVKLSQKRWYWSCSSCGHREEMSQSSLKRTYQTENKSFIHSIGTKKKKLDPDLAAGATLIDSRETTYNG